MRMGKIEENTETNREKDREAYQQMVLSTEDV
jgi:hypothetical protein